jgi:hypothetical protein
LYRRYRQSRRCTPPYGEVIFSPILKVSIAPDLKNQYTLVRDDVRYKGITHPAKFGTTSSLPPISSRYYSPPEKGKQKEMVFIQQTFPEVPNRGRMKQIRQMAIIGSQSTFATSGKVSSSKKWEISSRLN